MTATHTLRGSVSEPILYGAFELGNRPPSVAKMSPTLRTADSNPCASTRISN